MRFDSAGKRADIFFASAKNAGMINRLPRAGLRSAQSVEALHWLSSRRTRSDLRRVFCQRLITKEFSRPW
jgi:hypothetical protein